MASTKQMTIDEDLEEARTTIVESKQKFDRAFLAFEMFQVFLLVLAVICGFWSCGLIIGATKDAENFEPTKPEYFGVTISCQEGDETCYQKYHNECNQCRNLNPGKTDCPCDIGMIPTGGDIIRRNGGGCQVHYRLAEALDLKPTEVTVANATADTGLSSSGTVAKIGFGDKVGAALNKALFAHQDDSKKDVTIACPIDLGDDADCSLKTSDWESYKNQDQDDWQQSSNFYAHVMAMLPIWIILKMLSLDGQLIDMLIRKITCGLIQNNQGRLDDLMLDFDILERCPILRCICVNTVRYLRFKLASNALIWPLTTIGFNSKCGHHIYTKMPHEVVWYVASGLVLIDGGYLLLYYFAMSCCEKIKTYRVLYLPFLAATVMSVVIQVYTFAFTGSFSFILGWNFSLAFNFTMSFSFNAFGVIFSILSVLEQLALFVTIGKQIRKHNAEKSMDQAKDVADKVQNAGVKGANLLESTILGAKKNTENDRAATTKTDDDVDDARCLSAKANCSPWPETDVDDDDQHAEAKPNLLDYDLNKKLLDTRLVEMRSQHMVLSVKFDKNRNTNRFAAAVYKDWNMDAARIYNPNEINKTGECDVEDCWKHPEKCRARNFRQGKPTSQSCWKQSFFWHLQQIQSTKVPGVMVRIVEGNDLGAGQKIEKAMAEHLGTYVVEVHAKETDETGARNSRQLTFEVDDEVKALRNGGNVYEEGDRGSVIFAGKDRKGVESVEIMWHRTGMASGAPKQKCHEYFQLESKANLKTGSRNPRHGVDEGDMIKALPGRQCQSPKDYYRPGDVGRVIDFYDDEPPCDGGSKFMCVQWLRSGNRQLHIEVATFRRDFLLLEKAKKLLVAEMNEDLLDETGNSIDGKDGVYYEVPDETGKWHSTWYNPHGGRYGSPQPMVIHAPTADMETGVNTQFHDAKWCLRPYHGDGSSFSDLQDMQKLAGLAGRPILEAADRAFVVDKPWNAKWGKWVGTGRTKRFEEMKSVQFQEVSVRSRDNTWDEKCLLKDVQDKLKTFGITKEHLSMTATEADLDFVKEWQAKMPKPAIVAPDDKEGENEANFYRLAHDVLKEELKRRL